MTVSQSGAIVADPKRFPSGIKALAAYVRSKGLKLGLYGDIGTKTCGGFIGFNVSAVPDATADAKLAADAKVMMEWGITSLKVDGCYADAHTMNITYPKLGAALKAAAVSAGVARPWYSCSWPDYVADNVCHHKRTEPCLPLHQIASTCDSARLWMDISDSWNQPLGNGVGVKNIIDFWAANPQFATLRNALPPGATYVNDPDQLLIGSNGLSLTEAEVQMGMWALWSAPMILSVELRHGALRDEFKAILLNREVLALSDDSLGRQATLCDWEGCSHGSVIYKGGTSIWNKTLADGSVAVGMVNLGNFGNQGKAFGDFNISFKPEAVGLAGCDAFTARDLFKGTDLGTFHGAFWREVDESSMLLLRIACASPHANEGGAPPPPPSRLRWVDARPYVHGSGFPASEKSHFYDRLPAGAEHTTRAEVWSLSRDTAGMYAQFLSNASSLAVNVTYLYSTMYSWHFPSTGMAGMLHTAPQASSNLLNHSSYAVPLRAYNSSLLGIEGLDLYAFDTRGDGWRWVATTNPFTAKAGVQHVSPSFTSLPRGGSMVRYRLHLPLYNGIANLSIGVGGTGAVLQSDTTLRTSKKPVVWYGTSIAQGGVASRPGMAFTNIIARRIDREVLNFGLSGNCLMEPGVAQWLAQIDAAAFIIDCSWNMSPAMIANRTVPLVRQLRAAAPSTPIVLVEDTEDGTAWAVPAAKVLQADKRTNLAAAYATLTNASGSPDGHLFYVTGPQLYNWSKRVGGVQRAVISPTVGGCHPTDLGMVAIADYYSKTLPTILNDDEWQRPSKVDVRDVTVATASRADPEQAYHHEAALTSLVTESRKSDAREISSDPSVAWTPVGRTGGLGVMGRAFNSTATGEYFDRLPATAKDVVRDAVWELSRDATGMFVPFETNAADIYVHYVLDEPAEPLWHMPQSGTSGADLFRLDEERGAYRFVNAMRPQAGTTTQSARIVSGLAPVASHRFLLFLPLRAHIVNASIGVPKSAYLKRDEGFSADGVTMHGRPPIVWYGTSIDQGGVASRPGATYTNALTRSLNRMVLNFGFAGNGEDEVSVAKFLATLPAALFVLDCLPNLSANQVTERTGPLVRYLRANGHTTTPIVLAAGTTYGDHWVRPERNDEKRTALEAEFHKLVAAGDRHVHLVANRNDELFGYDEMINPTVGGTHPSDLGHREIASFYETYLPTLLPPDPLPHFDVVVYGSTPAGIAAAVAAGHLGMRVALFEPLPMIGGMGAAGNLALNDGGMAAERTGLAYNFSLLNGEQYGLPAGEEVPHPESFVAEATFYRMLAAAQVTTIKLDCRLLSAKRAKMANGASKVESISVACDPDAVRADVFIDASYDGELMVAIGDVEYTAGREANTTYNEPLAGARKPSWAGVGGPRHVDALRDDGRVIKFVSNLSDLKPPGEADDALMAFQHRMCISADNDRVRWPKPPGYNPDDFLLIQRALDASGGSSDFFTHLPPSRLPGYPGKRKKYCLCCGITVGSTDQPTLNKGWASASWERKQQIVADHTYFELGTFYYLANDPRVPLAVRRKFGEYGLCVDEFAAFGHIPPQLYVRISNRLVGDLVVTQNTIAAPRLKNDSIAVGDWSFDEHMTGKYAVPVPGKPGKFEVMLEGNFWPSIANGSNWYDVPYGVITPKRGTGANLLVPVAFSASAVAYSSMRIENMFMSVGTAAGVAAQQLVRGSVSAVQDVDVGEVQAVLAKGFGQRVHGPPHKRPPPPPPHKKPFYNVSGAGSAAWNGHYVYSGGTYKSTTCSVCSLYTYGGVWRLATYGQSIYYEAALRSQDPPLASSSWKAVSGVLPAPSLAC